MPNSYDDICANCGERIVLVNYALGQEWTHQPAGASFQDGVHQYCHKTVAAPRGEVKWMQSTGSPVAHAVIDGVTVCGGRASKSPARPRDRHCRNCVRKMEKTT